AKQNDDAETDEQAAGNERAQAADVVNPLADAEANNVKDHEDGQKCDRSGKRKGFAVRERSVRGTKSEDRNAHEIQHDGRHIHHVIGPVAPTRQKTMEVTEDFLSPQIDSAFARIAMSQLDDGDSLGPKKEQERNDPEPYCHAAVGRNRGDDVEVENGDDKQQD